jgi:hypothetical protein
MTTTALYKLTDEQDRTRGGTQWGEGVTHEASGEGELCGPGWIHAYTDPLLAVLLNSIHANFRSPHLWEATGVVGKTDHGLKVGCTRLTTLRRVPLPEVTTEQRVRFGILCALAVCDEPGWRVWAERWLSGEDRTAEAAARAESELAAGAAARAEAATQAAWAAVEATWAAEWTARASPSAAAGAAAWAAVEATWAAEWTAQASPLDLPSLARRAIEERL